MDILFECFTCILPSLLMQCHAMLCHDNIIGKFKKYKVIVPTQTGTNMFSWHKKLININEQGEMTK